MQETIIAITTFCITSILAYISKKDPKIDNYIIPIQNLLVGVIVAVIYFLITHNFSLSILSSGLLAGGTYDIVHNVNKICSDVKPTKECTIIEIIVKAFYNILKVFIGK